MEGLRRWFCAFAALCAATALSGCAESVAPPEAVLAIPSAEKASWQIGDISASAAPGVIMTTQDFDRIDQLIAVEVNGQRAKAAAIEPGRNVNLKLVFTRYDEGNRFARFMLAGLGQIYIDADVIVIDAGTRQTLGQYKVSKDFAFGGIYGGSTSIGDVERGFAHSVADIFKHPT